MSDSWWVIVMPLIISVVALVVPGIAVLAAGWGVRRLRILTLAPVVSIAILAVAAIAAPLAGLSWSILPVAIVTVVAAAAAFGLRRWVGRETEAPTSAGRRCGAACR